MLTKVQRKFLKPFLTAIDDARENVTKATGKVEELQAKVAEMEERRDLGTAALAATDAAHSGAVKVDNPASKDLWQEIQTMRSAVEEGDAELAIIREELTEAEADASRAELSVDQTERAFLKQLHACFVEGFNREVETLYEHHLAPIWYVEHLARTGHEEFRNGFDKLGTGVRDFFLKLPTLRGKTPTGERAPLLDKSNHVQISFTRAARGPGVPPEEADDWLLQRIQEILAA